MKTLRLLSLALLAIAAQATSAWAHPGHSVPGNGLAAGLMHPLMGWDHLLAMVAVGLLAAQIGGRAVWLAPCAFLASMIAGGMAGGFGTALPGMEFLIAGSVLLLGAAVAANRHWSLAVPVTLAVLFGLVHGYAHGLEMPRIDSPLLYGAGFVASSALLHSAGVLTGLAARRTISGQYGLRLSGGLIALSGLWLIVGV